MHVDGVAFESPVGLEDSTSYTYQAEGSPEELTIEFELPVGGGTPAEAVLAEIEDGLASYFQSSFRMMAKGDTTLAGEPAKFMLYRLTGDERIVSNIVVANIGPLAAAGEAAGQGDASVRDWVKVAWADDRELDAVDARLDPILASFAPADRPPPRVLPGHERRSAGAWVVDVPAELHGPRTFIFEDVEAELRVELSVLEPGADEPELEPGVATFGGEETAREQQTLDEGERVDLRVRSDADPHGESALILAKRKLELAGARAGEHRWVVLSATAPSSVGPRLTAIVDQLLASVRAQEETT